MSSQVSMVRPIVKVRCKQRVGLTTGSFARSRQVVYVNAFKTPSQVQGASDIRGEPATTGRKHTTGEVLQNWSLRPWCKKEILFPLVAPTASWLMLFFLHFTNSFHLSILLTFTLSCCVSSIVYLLFSPTLLGPPSETTHTLRALSHTKNPPLFHYVRIKLPSSSVMAGSSKSHRSRESIILIR